MYSPEPGAAIGAAKGTEANKGQEAF